MFVIIGLVVILGSVFGGFTLAGGKFDIIAKAAPFELMMIFGGGFGAFIMGNDGKTVGAGLKGIVSAMKGPKWKADDYQELLGLLFVLTKTIKSKGVVAIESHIENPEESKIFQNFPAVLSDHHVTEFICDYVRMMTMNFENPHQMEDIMDKEMEKHHAEAHEPAHGLQTMADGLPAIGIVAAVLGIIKTMGSISEPVEVLGKLVGGALVGTFLGIFLSYLLVAPFANRFGQVLAAEHQFFEVIKTVIIGHLQGNAPQISVELGRKTVPTPLQPSFAELEEYLGELPTDLA